MPVGGVGEKGGAHARAQLGGVEHGDHEAVVAGTENFQRAAQRGGVGDVAIDQKEAAHAGVPEPVAEVGDEGDRPAFGLGGDQARKVARLHSRRST